MQRSSHWVLWGDPTGIHVTATARWCSVCPQGWRRGGGGWAGVGGFEGFPQVALIRPHPEGHLDSRGGHRSNHQFTFKMLL